MITKATKITAMVAPPTMTQSAHVGSFVRVGVTVAAPTPPTAGTGAPVGGGGVQGPGGGGGAPGGAVGAATAGKPEGGVWPGATGTGADTIVSPAVGPAWCAGLSVGAAAPVATVRSACRTGRAWIAAPAARARSPVEG